MKAVDEQDNRALKAYWLLSFSAFRLVNLPQ